MLFYGGRYIYFIPRNAKDILYINHKFTIGNMGNFLFSYRYNWPKHDIELGYALQIVLGGKIKPYILDIIK